MAGRLSLLNAIMAHNVVLYIFFNYSLLSLLLKIKTMDRAQIAGVDDVGIGALFGLHDYRFECLAMLQHAQHLDKTYNAGPHTISIPRIRPADQAPDALAPPHPVDDENFAKLVAVLRCAVPYTGMILSTRESAAMRARLLQLGISQMSAGSKVRVSYSSCDFCEKHILRPTTIAHCPSLRYRLR